jgi:epoxyqueuosine reductase QueG
VSFIPDDVARGCDDCNNVATWKVYHRKTKRDEFYCDACVPAEGTPRYKRVEHRPEHEYMLGFPVDREGEERRRAEARERRALEDGPR